MCRATVHGDGGAALNLGTAAAMDSIKMRLRRCDRRAAATGRKYVVRMRRGNRGRCAGINNASFERCVDGSDCGTDGVSETAHTTNTRAARRTRRDGSTRALQHSSIGAASTTGPRPRSRRSLLSHTDRRMSEIKGSISGRISSQWNAEYLHHQHLADSRS